MSGEHNINDWDAPSIAVEALQNFLTANVAGLTVLDEWPYGNQKLTYPSVTIFAGEATRMPLMPETIAVTDPDGNNQVTATEVVAEYDFECQLDLWAINKLQRKQFLAKLLTAFASQSTDATRNNNPDGLTLILANYFNTPVRFEIKSHKHQDDEQAAERQERRELIRVIVNLREIRQRTYYAMRTIETHVGAQPNSQGSTATDNSGTDTGTV